MARPVNRRPGFSRRAQYGLFIGYVVAVAGVLAGLGLIVVAVVDPPGFAVVRGAALDLTAPVASAGRRAVEGARAGGEEAAAWWRAGWQNRALRAELATARRQLVAARVQQAENRRLRRFARLIERVPERVAAARIVGSTAGDVRRLATLMAGRAAGVRPGMPVRSADGLVGRVYEAGQIAARVLLLTDAASVVPVARVGDGAAALAAGRGESLIELRPLSAGQNPFRPGDLVATSGTGGVFPPGVPVALVVERRDDVALARPLADPARLDFAVVERPYAPPPPPAPAPVTPVP